MTASTTPPCMPVLYTVEEAAEILRISRWKVYDLIRNGDLRSIKIGRLRRVPLDAVHEFAAQPSPADVVA
jgi:excisionase family DNA binding protein